MFALSFEETQCRVLFPSPDSLFRLLRSTVSGCHDVTVSGSGSDTHRFAISMDLDVFLFLSEWAHPKCSTYSVVLYIVFSSIKINPRIVS